MSLTLEQSGSEISWGSHVERSRVGVLAIVPAKVPAQTQYQLPSIRVSKLSDDFSPWPSDYPSSYQMEQRQTTHTKPYQNDKINVVLNSNPWVFVM